MERKILFRGKVKYNGNHLFAGEWVFGSLIVKPSGTFIYIVEEDEFGNIVREFEAEIFPETVGQFTGLDDKNGKCIFEGDIYKRNTDLYLVTCTTLGGFLYRQIYDSWTKRNIFGKMEQSWLSAVECYKYEIIDNIIDNPELIKTI